MPDQPRVKLVPAQTDTPPVWRKAAPNALPIETLCRLPLARPSVPDFRIVTPSNLSKPVVWLKPVYEMFRLPEPEKIRVPRPAFVKPPFKSMSLLISTVTPGSTVIVLALGYNTPVALLFIVIAPPVSR